MSVQWIVVYCYILENEKAERCFNDWTVARKYQHANTQEGLSIKNNGTFSGCMLMDLLQRLDHLQLPQECNIDYVHWLELSKQEGHKMPTEGKATWWDIKLIKNNLKIGLWNICRQTQRNHTFHYQEMISGSSWDWGQAIKDHSMIYSSNSPFHLVLVIMSAYSLLACVPSVIS